MKKLAIALFVIAAVVALSAPVHALDMNLKKKSCETACDKTYKECTEKSKKEYEKSKNETKKDAGDLACKKAKEDCYKKCK